MSHTNLAKSKTVKIYLVDGDPNGLRTLEQSNWTGKGIACSRIELAKLKKRSEVKRTGIYILWGDHPNYPSKKKVYIGMSDSILKRVETHNSDDSKDWWTHVISFASKDENLTMAHAHYLESKLIADVITSGRAELANAVSPNLINLPESDVGDMDQFYNNICTFLPFAGLNILQHQTPLPQDATKPILEMNAVGTQATAVIAGDEIVVQRGSTARRLATPSWTTYKDLRDQLVDEGKLVPKDDKSL